MVNAVWVAGGSDEHLCRRFVRMWAEAVLRQVERVRELRVKAAKDGRSYERMDGGPTTERLDANSRALWTEEHSLVWTAYQLERWVKRLAEVRFDEPPEMDRVLQTLRHALEHLDAAEFDGSGAVPDDPLGQQIARATAWEPAGFPHIRGRGASRLRAHSPSAAPRPRNDHLAVGRRRD